MSDDETLPLVEKIDVEKGVESRFYPGSLTDTREGQESCCKQLLVDVGSGDLAIKEGENKANSLWHRSSWKQKGILAYVSLLAILDSLCDGAANSFFARVIIRKGGTVILSSMILRVTMIASAIFSVIFGRYQSRIGCKTLLILGLADFSLCQIAFGTIEFVDDEKVMIAYAAILRAFQGVGKGAMTVASLTVLCQEFPENIPTVFGIFEASYGAGYLSGAFVGGYLYDLSGGILLPMASTGTTTLLVMAFGVVQLKKYETWDDSGGKFRFSTLLGHFKSILIIGTTGTIIGVLALIDSTITVYLQPKGFSAAEVGFVLLVGSACYCIFTTLIGCVAGHSVMLRRLLLFAGLIGGLGIEMMFSPSQTRIWIYVAMSGFSTFSAISIVPSYDELLAVASSIDPENSTIDISLYSAVSGAWSACAYTAEFMFPLIGSALQETVPFSFSLLITTLIGFGTTIVLALLVFCFKLVKSSNFAVAIEGGSSADKC